MYRILFAAALVGLPILFASHAIAQPGSGRPPVIVSPDLTGPWVIQLKRGYRVGLSYPTLPRAVFRPAPSVQSRRGPAIDPAFLPRTIDYATSEAAGTIIIDTRQRYLYLILGDGEAKRYGIGVARPGFEWAGIHYVTRKAEWPEWVPPEEMRQRQPDLPTSMDGGLGNPLGARALYLGSTLYRIHGSDQPWTIGKAVSSGCIRMRNEDVIDLYDRVGVGTKVIVI
jgi:lipoprotein-anchoring transpeptidase ErfK/SrfK